MNLPIDIIHGADEVNLTAYTYSQIYAESASTITINNNEIVVPAGVLIPINIRSISDVNTVYCLGTKKNSFKAPDTNTGQYL
jgi:hypothetical protein